MYLIVLTRNGITVANAGRIGLQYILDSVATEVLLAAAKDDKEEAGSPDLNLLHKRFGHAGVQGLRGLHKVVTDLPEPITVLRSYNSDNCKPCIIAKQLQVVNC